MLLIGLVRLLISIAVRLLPVSVLICAVLLLDIGLLLGLSELPSLRSRSRIGVLICADKIALLDILVGRFLL